MTLPNTPTVLVRRVGAVCVVLGSLSAAGTAGANPAPSPAPPPPITTLVTDKCPHRDIAPPPVDASEVPQPGHQVPAPLHVPDQPVGGGRLGECGVVLPQGAPTVPPGIDSAGWLVADLTDGTVLAAKDPHGRYRPASTIKLLLIQVALRELNLDQVVEGTAEDAAQEGDAAGVSPGGRYTVRQLLEGLILVSGNDAAHALARQLGGVNAAVAKMNQLATTLGALDTRAATPSGLDGPGQTTSPYDLALILQSALADPRFIEIAATRQIVFPGHPPVPTTPSPPLPPEVSTSPPAPPTSVAPYPIINENRLLTEFPGAVAGKTGYTDDAKKTYVGAVDRNGHRYVVVQMFGLAYTGNTYWDQYRRLLDYAIALRGKSVGTLITATDETGAPKSERGSPSEGASNATPTVETGSGTGESSNRESSTGTRLAIGLGGLAVIIGLVVAALRTGRNR